MSRGGINNPGNACYLISSVRCFWSHFFNIKDDECYKNSSGWFNNNRWKIDDIYNECQQVVDGKKPVDEFLQYLKRKNNSMFGDYDVYRASDSRMFYRSLIAYIILCMPELDKLYYFKYKIRCHCFNTNSWEEFQLENMLVQGFDDIYGVIPALIGRQLQCKKCKRRHLLINAPKYFMIYCDKEMVEINKKIDIRMQRLNQNNYDKCYTHHCKTLSISTGGVGHSYAYVQEEIGKWVKYDDNSVTRDIQGSITDNIMFFIIDIDTKEKMEWPNGFDEHNMYQNFLNSREFKRQEQLRHEEFKRQEHESKKDKKQQKGSKRSKELDNVEEYIKSTNRDIIEKDKEILRLNNLAKELRERIDAQDLLIEEHNKQIDELTVTLKTKDVIIEELNKNIHIITSTNEISYGKL